MPTLGFYVGGVSASAFGATEDSAFAHIVVGNKDGDTVTVTTCGEVMRSGDTGFGKLQNKVLHYGWMSCNTDVGGVFVGTDNSGNTLPLRLANKYIEISVDCGTTFSGWDRVNTKFKVSNLKKDGNKGSVLFEFDGLMRIWAGRWTSDVELSGELKSITGKPRLKVAEQVLNAHASTL